MKVEIESRADEFLDKYDYREYLKISVDGVEKFRVQDGEPEDSNLCRDFNGCHNIKELMQLSYDAGKNGETLEFEKTKGEY